MFRSCLVLVSLLCAVAGEFSNPSTLMVPCNKNEENCRIKSANSVISLITPGIPSLNIAVLDPFKPDVIEVRDPKFSFKFTNNTIKGLGTCEIITVKFNPGISKLNITFKCPTLILDGRYEVYGEFIEIPINASGYYKFTTGKMFYEFDCVIEKVKGNDGEMHLTIKDYYAVVNAEDQEVLYFDTAFTPKNKPANVINDFNNARDNEIHRVVKPVFVKTVFKSIVGSANKLLAAVSYDHFLSNEIFCVCVINFTVN